MQYLKRLSQLLLTACGLSFSLFAWAEGTDSGTTVTNNVELSFTVASVDQTASADVSFVVDRKLRLDVGALNGNWVTAVAGQSGTVGAPIQFEITNNSNDGGVEVVVALMDQSLLDVDGFDAVGATPIAPPLLTIWEDTNADGVFDGGEPLLGNAAAVYTLPTVMSEDEVRTISVAIEVPLGAVADSYQTFTLVAAVASGGTVIGNDDSGNISPSGTAANVGNLLGTVQIVFADDGSGFNEDEGFDFIGGVPTAAFDGLYDGQSSNAAGFRTVGVLGVAKYVEVLWDPISTNGYDATGTKIVGTDPKSIPGAVLIYVIGVTNQSSLLASAVDITDDVPGGAPGDPLLLGNAFAIPGIELPNTVDIDIDGTLVTFDLDNANIDVDSQVYIRACDPVPAASVGAPGAFNAVAPEVDEPLGDCATGEAGYVVYFATVDNA